LINAEADRGALRLGEWKLLVQATEDKVELYNLSLDPGEKKDLAATEKEKVSELLRYYREFQTAAQPALASQPKQTLPTPAVWGEWTD
jgi:hypothetical protein